MRVVRKPIIRANERIRSSPIRLIGSEGEQLGILPVKEALTRARTQNLDLVEVAPGAKPPVCRIMDYGKYKYEISKKQKVARKKQHSTQLKEMRFRPKVDTHDYEFKTKHVREFIMEGNKVKVFVMFRGREMAHTELGRRVLDRVAEDLKEIAAIENAPKQEGRHMIMVMAPQAHIIRQAAKIRADKVAESEGHGEGLAAEGNETGKEEHVPETQSPDSADSSTSSGAEGKSSEEPVAEISAKDGSSSD